MRESAKNVNGSSICNFLDTKTRGMVQIGLVFKFGQLKWQTASSA